MIISRLVRGLHCLLRWRCRMASKKKERKALPPIWRVPDELWVIAGPIIAG